MRVNSIVLGAAGFVGRHLGRALANRGEVVGYDVVAHEEGFACLVGDVARDAPDLAGANTVFYLSQSPHYRAFAEHGDDLFAVNVTGALRSAIAAAAAGASLFVYASTGSVYAPSFAPLAEDAPLRRDDPYALSKSTAEDALRLLGGDLRVVCVRLFGVFGPGQRTMLVPAITQRVREGQPITIEGNPQDPSDDGGLRISLTYVDDVVAIFTRLAELTREGRDLPGVLNVAAADAVDIRRLASSIGRRLGVEPVFEDAGRARSSDLIADISRLEALCAPRFTDFEVAIERTLEAS